MVPSELNRRLSRRDFVLGVGALSTGMLAKSRAGAMSWASQERNQSPKWRMRLSASSINFSSLPIEEACQRIADLGFEAIDIWSAHAGCPHLDDVQRRLGAEGLQRVLKTCGLKLYAFSVYSGGYMRYADLLGQCGGGEVRRPVIRRTWPPG